MPGLGPSELSFLSYLLMALITPLWVAAAAAIAAWMAGVVRRHLPRRRVEAGGPNAGADL